MISAEYRDLATPRLKQILADLSPAQRRLMLGRLGKALEGQLKAHFRAREQEGNKRGWPSRHFWAREGADKTALRSVTADQAVVGIDSVKFAHKVTGGTIVPGPGKRFLAIPMRPEAAAEGVRPSGDTFPGLFVVRSKILGKAWLATREGGALRFYWRLVPSVHQDPDPRALPPAAQLRSALEKRAELEVNRIVQQAT
jgi:hypothetical protein